MSSLNNSIFLTMDIDTSAKNACDDYNPSRSEWTSLLTSMIRENNKSWQDKFDALSRQRDDEQREMQVHVDGWKKSYYDVCGKLDVLFHTAMPILTEILNTRTSDSSTAVSSLVAAMPSSGSVKDSPASDVGIFTRHIHQSSVSSGESSCHSSPDLKCKQQEDLDKVKERTSDISNFGNSNSMIAVSTLVAENSYGSVLPTTDVEAEIEPNHIILPCVHSFSFQSPKAVSNLGSSCRHQLPSVVLPPPKNTALAPHKVPPDLLNNCMTSLTLSCSIIRPTQHSLGFHFFQRTFEVPALRLLFYNNRFYYLWQRPVFTVPAFRLLLYNSSRTQCIERCIGVAFPNPFDPP